jgi:bifunctional polynucleotide phosphatase/kinase
MKWSDRDTHLVGTYGKQLFPEKIAGFDFDGTLIKTKSGAKFARHENDWTFLYKGVPKKLRELSKTHNVVIFTNQRGLNSKKRTEEWKNKVNKFVQKLDIPIKIIAAIHNDNFRKPRTGMYQTYYTKNDHSFYVGDACGRKNDFADTDYKFALNLRIKFYTPEFFFRDIDNIRDCKASYFFDIKNIETGTYTDFIPADKELIIMMGFQGSGKSYYTKKYIEVNNYCRVNRDLLGTMKKCEKECKKLMSDNKNIVIDNTNPSIKSRSGFIKIAKEHNYNIRLIEFKTSFEQSVHNMWYRHFKENKPILPKIAQHMYKKNYQSPSLDEGFDNIEELQFKLDIDTNTETGKLELDLYSKYYE